MSSRLSRSFLGAALLGIALLAAAAPARAAGLAIDGAELAAPARAALSADIGRARAASPDAFREVTEVVASAAALDAASRRPGTPLTLHFKPLGARALLPMLDLLAFSSSSVPTGLPTSARSALRVGLIEAVGLLRDARAVPVLARVVLTETDPETTQAAAEALGRIGTNDALVALDLALASHPSDERDRALLPGLGAFRRLDATERLTRRARAAALSPATARVIAKALGVAGNAWAWKTLPLPARAPELAVRDAAAAALLDLFLHHTGEARQSASNALLVVAAPSTSARLAILRRTASTDTLPAMDELAVRLSKNPTQ